MLLLLLPFAHLHCHPVTCRRMAVVRALLLAAAVKQPWRTTPCWATMTLTSTRWRLRWTRDGRRGFRRHNAGESTGAWRDDMPESRVHAGCVGAVGWWCVVSFVVVNLSLWMLVRFPSSRLLPDPHSRRNRGKQSTC